MNRFEMAAHIRERVTRLNLTYTWLIAQLYKRGITTDRTSISAMLSGARTGPKAELVVSTADTILEEYEQCFIQAGREDFIK